MPSTLDDESRQRLMDEFLQDFARDRCDGMTTRALFKAFEEHRQDDKASFARIDDRLNETRVEVAHQEGYLAAKSRNGANGNGGSKLWQRIAEKPLVMLLSTIAIALASLVAHAFIHAH
jgi:hypothetical protein